MTSTNPASIIKAITEEGTGILEKLSLTIVIIVAASIIIKVIDNILGRLFNVTKFDPTLEKFVHKSIVTVLWLLALATLLVMLGVDVSAVVASFGMASFIVGFALKDTLSNLASGVMILLNKPFKVGDVIMVKDVKGKVKTVSMSYTRIITEDNNKVTIPNSIVWGNPITNFTAYKKK